MSELRGINELNEVGETIGKNQHRQQEARRGAARNEGHVLLSASQKAIRELASALERDSDGWQAEREMWAKERASLEASLDHKEGRLEAMKKETTRLVRMVRQGKHEHDRLSRESLRLKQENASLLTRNDTLHARNLQMRQQIETVAERNRKLHFACEQALQGIGVRSAAPAGGDALGRGRGSDRKRGQVSPAVDVGPLLGSVQASAVKVDEPVRCIVVPNPDRSCRSDGAGGGTHTASSSRDGGVQPRSRPLSERSDTDEVITPRGTDFGGSGEPAAAAAAAETAHDRSNTTPNGGGRVDEGWKVAAAEAVDDAARQESGRVGAPPLSRSGNERRGGLEAACKPRAEERNVLAFKNDVTGVLEDEEVLFCHASSRRPPFTAATSDAPPPCPTGRRQVIATSDGENWGFQGDRDRESHGRSHPCSADGSTLSTGAPIDEAGHREAASQPPSPPTRPLSPPSLPRFEPPLVRLPSVAAAATDPTPATSDRSSRAPASLSLAAPKPPRSTSSSRKRSRLSLGGGIDNRAHNGPGRARDITVVLEAPRPRSAAATGAGTTSTSTDARSNRVAAAAAAAGLSETATREVGNSGRASSDGPKSAGPRRRAGTGGIHIFPGALLAAERIGAARGGAGGSDNSEAAAAAAATSGGGQIALAEQEALTERPGRVKKEPVAKGQQRRPAKQQARCMQQRSPRHFLEPTVGKRRSSCTRSSSPSSSPTSSAMRESRTRADADRSEKKDQYNSRSDHRERAERNGRSGRGTVAGPGENERGWIGADDRNVGDGGADSAASSTGANDVTYPRLTMAAVNSPAKKKPRSKRQQQQQGVIGKYVRDPQDRDRRESGSAVAHAAAAAAPAAASGGGGPTSVRQRPAPRASEISDADARSGGRAERRAEKKQEDEDGVEAHRVGEGAKPPKAVNADDDGDLDLPQRKFPTMPVTNARDATKSGGGGGRGGRGEGGGTRGGRSGPAGERRAAPLSGARQRQDTANFYKAGVAVDAGGAIAGNRTRNGGYKFQEVVRDRGKRAAMKGHDCEHCAAYIAAVGGSPREREAMLNMCSRHKYTEENGRPAETPDGFWDLSFADSVDPDKERGQVQQQPAPFDGGGGGKRQSAGHGSLDF